METNRSRSPISATKSFCFRGLTKSNTNANVAPPAEGQKRLLFRFSALDAAVVKTIKGTPPFPEREEAASLLAFLFGMAGSRPLPK